MQETGIAWSYDKNHLYGPVQPQNFNTEPDRRGGNTSTVDIDKNEHLMVWLRPGAKPTIRKLWGKINTPLAAGTIAFLMSCKLQGRKLQVCSVGRYQR